MDQRKKVFRATQTVNKAMVSLDPAIIRMETERTNHIWRVFQSQAQEEEMIYDTFLFDGEWEMLKLRQETLKGKVDAHVALMGIRSFRGNSKAVFTPVLAPDLKTTFELCALPSFSDPWISEHWQRNFALHKLWGLAPNDIVLIGDVDEIPDPENVTHIGAHSMEFFMYNQNWSKKQKWIGTVGVTGQHILEGIFPAWSELHALNDR